jgi:glutamate-1-semialdehyde 2,1-aminomutase
MTKNQQLYKKSLNLMPGGVNSPVRAFGAVGGNPLFVKRAKGAYFWDADGKRYIDYCLSWGPMLLGHANPKVLAAIQKSLSAGTSFGINHENEIKIAELIRSFYPSIEKVRLVSSGTEAVMSAVRLARGVTGREKILKFEGCYHGHADSFLVKAGSGAATFGKPSSLGVPKELAKLTLTAPFNDLEKVEMLFKKHGNQIACIVVEPVAGNMGCVLPSPRFLEGLKVLTKKYKALLIFDEVMAGFRIASRGIQGVSGVKPDLTCLGKVVGGGMPLAAFGGQKRWMNQLAPHGGIYQAGTLSGNPLAVAAGIATLQMLKKSPGLFRKAQTLTDQLTTRVNDLIKKEGLPWTIQSMGTLWTLFFTPKPVRNFQDVAKSDLKEFARYFQAMLKSGIYVAPSAFEANFLSSAHTEADILKTVRAIKKFASSIARGERV